MWILLLRKPKVLKDIVLPLKTHFVQFWIHFFSHFADLKMKLYFVAFLCVACVASAAFGGKWIFLWSILQLRSAIVALPNFSNVTFIHSIFRRLNKVTVEIYLMSCFILLIPKFCSFFLYKILCFPFRFPAKSTDCGYRFNDAAKKWQKSPGVPPQVQAIVQTFIDVVNKLHPCFEQGDVKCLRDAIKNVGIAGLSKAKSLSTARLSNLIAALLAVDTKVYEDLKSLPPFKNVAVADKHLCEMFDQNIILIQRYLKGN